jgi:hypothetical protein
MWISCALFVHHSFYRERTVVCISLHDAHHCLGMVADVGLLRAALCALCILSSKVVMVSEFSSNQS